MHCVSAARHRCQEPLGYGQLQASRWATEATWINISFHFRNCAQQVVGAGKFFLFVLNVLQSGEVGMPNKLASVWHWHRYQRHGKVQKTFWRFRRILDLLSWEERWMQGCKARWFIGNIARSQVAASMVAQVVAHGGKWQLDTMAASFFSTFERFSYCLLPLNVISWRIICLWVSGVADRISQL